MTALDRATAGAQQTAGRQKFTGASQSVLIITEREEIAKALTQRMGGYRVVCVANLERALSYGLDEAFDLVVAHIDSPDAAVLDGLEVLRAYDADLPLVLFADALPPAALADVAASLGVLDVLADLPTKDAVQRLLSQATNERCAAALRELDAPSVVPSAGNVVMHPVVDPRTLRVTAFMARGGTRALAVSALTLRPGSLFVEARAAELFDGSLLRDPALASFASRVVLQIRLDDAALRHADLLGRLASLRRAGYRLALVECAVRHYVDLPPIGPDFLVLDARLTRRIGTSRGRREIVRTLAAKAHSLDALVVAVGVATAEERTALVDARCDLVEGPLVARRR